jgi:hypothetical protein
LGIHANFERLPWTIQHRRLMHHQNAA